MTWTIPNLLTFGRLAAAPMVPGCYLVWAPDQAAPVALALFVAAALTDFVDGYLARAWNQQSPLGTMLDPIADKAMVISALALVMALAGPDPGLWLPALAILMREVLVSGLREHLGDIKLPVTRAAKLKTTVQMVAIAALLAPPAWGLGAPGLGLLWAAAGLTLLTGAQYFATGLRHLRARG